MMEIASPDMRKVTFVIGERMPPAETLLLAADRQAAAAIA
jgi:hypothetical protein